jgi:hypothetical protein
MAVAEEHSIEELQREIGAERQELAAAVDSLRHELALEGKLRSRLPAVATAALVAGFVLGGGIGATVRLIFRRRRER